MPSHGVRMRSALSLMPIHTIKGIAGSSLLKHQYRPRYEALLLQQLMDTPNVDGRIVSHPIFYFLMVIYSFILTDLECNPLCDVFILPYLSHTCVFAAAFFRSTCVESCRTISGRGIKRLLELFNGGEGSCCRLGWSPLMALWGQDGNGERINLGTSGNAI